MNIVKMSATGIDVFICIRILVVAVVVVLRRRRIEASLMNVQCELTTDERKR